MYFRERELPARKKLFKGREVICTKTFDKNLYKVGERHRITTEGFLGQTGLNGSSAEWILVDEVPFDLKNYL